MSATLDRCPNRCGIHVLGLAFSKECVHCELGSESEGVFSWIGTREAWGGEMVFLHPPTSGLTPLLPSDVDNDDDVSSDNDEDCIPL